MSRETWVAVVAAIGLGGVAFVCFGAAEFDEAMAEAETSLATQQYRVAEERLQAAAGSAGRARWAPWIAGAARHDLDLRIAALQYWRGEYDALIASGDEVPPEDAGDAERLLIVANAVYRAGARSATDQEASLQALDEAVAAYRRVLDGATWLSDAAYNYELVVRARADAESNPPSGDADRDDAPDADLGEEGAPTPSTAQDGFQIYIPLEDSERNRDGTEAGEGGPLERKG